MNEWQKLHISLFWEIECIELHKRAQSGRSSIFVINCKFFILHSGDFSHLHQLVIPNSVWRTFSIPYELSGTLGRIIFIHLLRSTVSISLSQSDTLPRYYLDCFYTHDIVQKYFRQNHIFYEIFYDTIHIMQRH